MGTSYDLEVERYDNGTQITAMSADRGVFFTDAFPPLEESVLQKCIEDIRVKLGDADCAEVIVRDHRTANPRPTRQLRRGLLQRLADGFKIGWL